jgi:hypothetical protein
VGGQAGISDKILLKNLVANSHTPGCFKKECACCCLQKSCRTLFGERAQRASKERIGTGKQTF